MQVFESLSHACPVGQVELCMQDLVVLVGGGVGVEYVDGEEQPPRFIVTMKMAFLMLLNMFVSPFT